MNARADWRTTLVALTPGFAARAAELNDTDDFVADNYRELKESGLIAAGVPEELGGVGLEVEGLCEMLRSMAHACPSTALAFSMHTHQVAVNAWRWRHSTRPPDFPPERVLLGVQSALQYARHSPVIRVQLGRTLLFVGAASCVWALLPLLARDRLGLEADGYGLLLGDRKSVV